jgi:ATP-dependent RNA helicase DDX5/DBP2
VINFSRRCSVAVQDPRMGPTVLVLAPTRELAVQIKEEADKFGKSSGIRNT